jgi:hypothetical protein
MEWIVEPLNNFKDLIPILSETCPSVLNQCTCTGGLASCTCQKGLQVSPQ